MIVAKYDRQTFLLNLAMTDLDSLFTRIRNNLEFPVKIKICDWKSNVDPVH